MLQRRNMLNNILHDQSGYVNHGETLYIMGASGAGKTTLLNSLCDRVKKSGKFKFTGEVMINDTLSVSQKNFGKYGAYVMQNDILFTTFTCEE